MSIHAALTHVTHYQYDRLVNLGPQVIRLRPAPHCRSKIISYSLKVEPANHFINWQQDPFANYQGRLVFPEKTREFKVTVDLVVEMAVYNPFDFFLEPSAEKFPFKYEALLKQELAPYLAAEHLSKRLKACLARIDRRKRRTIDFLVDVNQMVHQDISYLIRMEPGVQSPDETLKLGSGSCRDSAWLLVQLLRHCGLAARFVSGYLIQLKPDVKSLDGPSGTEVDFTDLHAWCEVYLPGAGWVGLDATSGLLAGEGHIPLACTPQPSGAAPIEGGMDKCEVTFAHRMEVTRIYESPRVTKPYTEAQWMDVMALGSLVDQELVAGDVRLTMGGEPTFVAVDDRDAPEWNTDALGPTKRGFATELVQKLRTEYGQGGFLHFGQGKWYPGEQLPRWALNIYWRADQQPVWASPALFADEREPTHYSSADARRFTQALAVKLGVTDEFVQSAYEDLWYYQWRERRLPVNVDPLKSKLEDEMERARLRRVFSQKLDTVVGFVLPIKVADESGESGPQWTTGSWFLRDERMYLMPGDSPMGLRLPLDSLPWVNEADYPYLVEQDPFNQRGDLPAHGALATRYAPGAQASIQSSPQLTHAATRVPQPQESAAWVTRTALCVEVRDPRRASGPKAEAVGEASGVIYIFMPPVEKLEHYLDLLAAIEATAEELKVQIVLEGYPPPRDPRLKLLQVTPDPGVIEVNIHPVSNWADLVRNTEFLYNAAFESRLSAEKFMTDGRHTGTGGGNHFVMGGATPDDSPFLRKPELLASLLLYWHNHPALSYLFSGMFVGPTSQAPRVDEARNDQLYELEIAIEQIYQSRALHGHSMPPWLVDRTLRNILIDATGNTHRSEISIDKMYSPDSATGRLGLLELRAFEMPPHPHMSSVQQLLLRALVARFWKAPYQAPATRWGTELHDRFMLPTFIKMDFDDVMGEMRSAGYAFDDSWFAPHYEFRFPLVGTVQSAGIELTLRNALEPWHVMGEEGAPGGTARYVDSSLERIEVRVSGLNQSRYVITCNGRALPLQSTGTTGEFVAGVRYKAWNPPSSLHPSIGIHSPLIFDIVDTWMKRSLGGCQYHVTHPGGLSYDTFPVNSYEAESRRMSRFVAMGHSPGVLQVPPATINVPGSREFPFTLDLRRA
ncbi:MAG: transglutaminase family protein [Gammaproteobacteria bacterium]|uniref:transglutaminase family protein n=1 Tax=Rhodoferax sp. TaxID=50421 RepID=UPI001805085C|nr:transglutaminase family protein [Rhodoferax sp.]MBU3900901.1 transglutaminase family protein [Gammaproteobacteria bacterium]MBA3057502.1 transglutaminase family protein [Rhodoferax sp.]MBU3998325.1 transglutaminase family protein [Gammaproteobacteria bacterium]MBU4017550.1 transglutaminase family protein [Gammaproteobacteria bacterium]MBU4078730.1 transglutaminase family protein [Gammaproteobacteria bacterium]